jgi:hypothetical protein
MTDSNPKTWGTVIEGVPVVSPEDARSSGNHVFAIGSCAFAADIEAAVRRHYAQSTHAPQVFSAISELAA